MCGIVGVAGKKEALPVLLDGLERLEYRGYDSAGVAVVSSDGDLQVKKSKGRLAVLREILDTQSPCRGILELVTPDGQHMENQMIPMLIHMLGRREKSQ